MKQSKCYGAALVVSAATLLLFWNSPQVKAGKLESTSDYRVLAPIRKGNLSIFPVVTSASHDTKEFLTLDEGLRSGEVAVTELGNIALVRPRSGHPVHDGQASRAEVNRLVLVNNSDRPLILLAGEIVTGGKQDRVIGKDRIVSPKSDPVDLSVFCVEPGRWTEETAHFKPLGTQMAQPAVRARAMADKDQAKVWSEVGNSAREMVAIIPMPQAAEVEKTSSYATVMSNQEVQKKIDAVAAPMEHDYQSVIRELRNHNAVGVVVAVNGQIIWADIFASANLLEKYWPKLVRSYSAEAVTTRGSHGEATLKEAQAFVDHTDGNREVAESEPGLYRHAEVSGDGFKVFELTSLLPKTGFSVHLAKMVV